jgi:hypothetical protein
MAHATAMKAAYDATLITSKFNDHPRQMIPLAGIAMGLGFIQYIYCFFMTRRDGISPFPPWMHAFYLAHDFLYVTLYDQWFGEYAPYRSFIFQGIWLGMVAFNFFEINALYSSIRDERQPAFGQFHDGSATKGQATVWVVFITVLSFVLLSTARSFLNDTLMFGIFVSTNVIMAIVPAFTTAARRKRVEGSLGLAFFIVVGTVATFLPEGLGMYTTADPDYFARPWFFILGATCVLIAIWHLVMVAQLSLQVSLPAKSAPTARPKK